MPPEEYSTDLHGDRPVPSSSPVTRKYRTVNPIQDNGRRLAYATIPSDSSRTFYLLLKQTSNYGDIVYQVLGTENKKQHMNVQIIDKFNYYTLEGSTVTLLVFEDENENLMAVEDKPDIAKRKLSE